MTIGDKLIPEREQNPAFPVVVVGGFHTASVSRQELANRMASDCKQARTRGTSWLPKLVFSSNGQGIALAGQDEVFAKAMSEADIIHADGMPVVFASRMTKHPLPERISTTDFFHDAARQAERDGLRFFILGSTEEQNRAAVEAINRMYPALEIVGRRDGYFTQDDEEAVCREIRDSKADVLWVALGKPRQELWAVRNRSKLAGVGWVKTCGGLYAFLTGDARRAPPWMQRCGLEWLYRMAQEPQRLALRYLMTNPYSFYRLLRHTKR